MSNALENLHRKKSTLRDVKDKSAQSRIQWLAKEEEAKHSLENMVAFIVVGKHETESRVARELGCSRDKVRGMIARANKRNRELMLSGHERED